MQFLVSRRSPELRFNMECPRQLPNRYQTFGAYPSTKHIAARFSTLHCLIALCMTPSSSPVFTRNYGLAWMVYPGGAQEYSHCPGRIDSTLCVDHNRSRDFLHNFSVLDVLNAICIKFQITTERTCSLGARVTSDVFQRLAAIIRASLTSSRPPSKECVIYYTKEQMRYQLSTHAHCMHLSRTPRRILSSFPPCHLS